MSSERGAGVKKTYSVSVRQLAEFAFEKGDLIPSRKNAARMKEGVRGHQTLQQLLPANWRPEAPVSRDIQIDGSVLRVHGRTDAVLISDETVHILEIKTVHRDPATLLRYDYPAHWAQGEIYAALFCLNEGIPYAEVRLVYARLDGRKQEFREEYEAWELIERLMAYAGPCLQWISTVETWKEKAEPSINALGFPFEQYREGQRDMAGAVYMAMRDGANTLIEAPTGIGKTAAALFGALKALGRGYITSIFYLTARTTGRRAAQEALERMRSRGLELRSVTITAKEKICPVDGADCLGCPLACGYYDRRRDALHKAMAIQRLDEEMILRLGAEYELCPFELSLDLAQNAEVVICDYNYVFDPRVRLKRFFDARSKVGLLVDEAHNLSERARDMLSAEVSGDRAEKLLALVRRYEGDKSPMGQLLKELLCALDLTDAEMEDTSKMPEEIVEAIGRFSQIASELEPAEPELTDFVFQTQWFFRVSKMYDEECYRTLILPGDRYLSVRLWCFDPSIYLKKALSRVGGAALFSATLSPMEFYAATLGVDGDADTTLRLGSPFPPQNLYIATVPVAVGMKDRERTMSTVVRVIHTMGHCRCGNYIACFPSYAYMLKAFRTYRMLYPEDTVICQQEHMSEKERGDFVDRFQPFPRRSLIAFVVLGGVFAEGVDLPEDRLSGAAIVSVGIPQITYERELLRRQLEDGDDSGYDAAYVYPGLRRVLQAAGRVIRTETDRGVVLLIDMRYRQEKYRTLLPLHWDVRSVKKMSELSAGLKEFWKGEGPT